MTAVTATHPAVAGFNLASILGSTQPSVALHPKPLLHSLGAFQAAIDSYVHKGKQEIARRKEAHTSRLKEDADRKRELEDAIEREKRRELELIEALEKEKLETKEMDSSIYLLKKQLASLTEQATSLDAEANDLRERIARLRKGASYCHAVKGISITQLCRKKPRSRRVARSSSIDVTRASCV